MKEIKQHLVLHGASFAVILTLLMIFVPIGISQYVKISVKPDVEAKVTDNVSNKVTEKVTDNLENIIEEHAKKYSRNKYETAYHDNINLLPVSYTEVQCLALNLYHEARGESERGKIAVGMVTLNREYSKKFPDTLCEVVYQSRMVNGNPKYCQFSWHCDSNLKKVMNYNEYKKVESLAEYMILNYKAIKKKDPTHGALYYHTKSMRTAWSDRLKKTITIGNHSFYK